MVDDSGYMTRNWQIFFRDMYRRTAYKGDNAIDNNSADILDKTSVVSSHVYIAELEKRIDELDTAQGLSSIAYISQLEKRIDSLEQTNNKQIALLSHIAKLQNKIDDIEQSIPGINPISINVTDAYSVSIAGAVMESDTTTALMQFVIDEDSFVSDLATKVPTQQSVKAYIASEIAGALTSEMTYKGGYDAATNTPLLDATPITTAKGDVYTVTVAGNFFTAAVEIGDVLISEIDSATLEADWTIVQKNLDAASIKVSYESNADTNEFSDAEQTKVANTSGTNTGDEPAASLTVPGIVELATVAETNTGTDATRAVTPDGLDSWTGSVQITKLGTIIAFLSTGIDDNATSLAMTINASENIGIGVTNPLAYDTTATRLHIKSGLAEVARFEGETDADGASATVRIGTSNDRGLYLEGGRAGVVGYAKLGVTDAAGNKTVAITLDSVGNVTLAGNTLIGTIKSGATQGAAGAAATELWKTAGHATLPDNVILIGV